MEVAATVSIELIKLALPLVAGRLPTSIKSKLTSDTQQILLTLKAQAQSRFFEAAVMSKRLETMLNSFSELLDTKSDTTVNLKDNDYIGKVLWSTFEKRYERRVLQIVSGSALQLTRLRPTEWQHALLAILL